MNRQEVDEMKSEVIDLLPWGISALTHVALVLLAMFVVYMSMTKVDDETPTIPTTVWNENAKMKITMRPETEKRKPLILESSPMPKKDYQFISNITKRVRIDPQKLLGAANAPSASIAGLQGSDDGFSQPFRIPTDGGPTRSVAYLIDASGSLVDTFPFVISELKRSINSLNEKQKFTVIFFQGDRAIEGRSPGLKKATATARRAAIRWFDPSAGNIVPHGQSDPLPAIKRALTYKPQLLFVLSDNITGKGRWERDQKSMLAEIRRANVAATKINTVQFIHEDPLKMIGMGRTLEKISDMTGGRFKFVDARMLGLD